MSRTLSLHVMLTIPSCGVHWVDPSDCRGTKTVRNIHIIRIWWLYFNFPHPWTMVAVQIQHNGVYSIKSLMHMFVRMQMDWIVYVFQKTNSGLATAGDNNHPSRQWVVNTGSQLVLCHNNNNKLANRDCCPHIMSCPIEYTEIEIRPQ